jgi:hypothetical protein
LLLIFVAMKAQRIEYRCCSDDVEEALASALEAENTLGREDSLPILGIVGDTDIHRADSGQSGRSARQVTTNIG